MILNNNINNFNLYIVQTGDIVKIGYSSQMYKRLQAYKHHNPLTYLHCLGYSTNAYEIEQMIHSTVESHLLREWYHVNKLPEILDVCTQKGVEFTYFNTELCKSYELNPKNIYFSPYPPF